MFNVVITTKVVITCLILYLIWKRILLSILTCTKGIKKVNKERWKANQRCIIKLANWSPIYPGPSEELKHSPLPHIPHLLNIAPATLYHTQTLYDAYTLVLSQNSTVISCHSITGVTNMACHWGDRTNFKPKRKIMHLCSSTDKPINFNLSS